MAKLPPSSGSIPEPVGASKPSAPKPKIPPTPRWVYMYHPERWGIIEGELVPLLAKFKIGRPGLNGVERNGAATTAIAKRRERGWVLIPEDVGGEGTNYLRRHDLDRGREAYCDQFEKVWPGSPQVSTDIGAYVAWLKGLIADGTYVGDCPDFTLQRLLADASKTEQDVVSMLTAAPPSARPRLEQELAQARHTISIITARLEQAEPVSGEAPAPKSKRGSRGTA